MRAAGENMACSLVLVTLWAGSVAAQGSGYEIKDFDMDDSAKLEPKEFGKFLQTTPAAGQPKDQVRAMFKRIDTNNDNGVDQSEFDEFLNQMARDAPPPPPPPPPKKKSAKKDKRASELEKRQIKSLQDFYKKHAPDKDPDAVTKLASKAIQRSGESWYTDMCTKLEEKYGENPSVYLESEDTKSSGNEKSNTDSKETSEPEVETDSAGTSHSEAAQALKTKAGKSRKVRKQILTAYYGKHAPEKTAEDIDKIIAKREGKGAGSGWFFDMCDKLTTKYGEDVFEYMAEAKEESSSATSNDPEPSSDEQVTSEGGDGPGAEEQQDESSTTPPEGELSPREKLLERLAATAQGIDDLEALEELVKTTEKAAEDSAKQAAEAAEAKAEEERIKAEEEAKAKAERKAAARARAEKAKAEAAERRAKEEAAEEAALELETFDPIDLDDESSVVLVDAELVDWLDEQRLADYTPQIVSYGGKLSEIMRRIKSDDIAGFGMSMAESARLKKGLKKLRKDARAKSVEDEELAGDATAEADAPSKEGDDAESSE